MNMTKGHRIRCPHCEVGEHAKVAEVRACADWDLYVRSGEAAADQAAEIAAEMAVERFFEEGTAAQQMAYQGELEMDAQALGLWS